MFFSYVSRFSSQLQPQNRGASHYKVSFMKFHQLNLRVDRFKPCCVQLCLLEITVFGPPVFSLWSLSLCFSFQSVNFCIKCIYTSDVLLEVVSGGQVHVGVSLAHIETVVLSYDATGVSVFQNANDQEQEVDQVGSEADHTNVFENHIEDVAQID